MADTDTETQTPKPITPEQLDLLTYVHTHYQLYGTIPSEDAASEYGIPRKLFIDAFNNSTFRSALEERGIILKRFEGDDWTSKGLTPHQLLVANQLLDLTDQRTTKKKLQELQVNTQTYQAWLKDPAFAAYLKTRAQQLLGENDHEVNLAFLDKIRSGDIKAVQFYYEMMGIYVPQRAGVNQVDVQGLIVKIIEIIDDVVDDNDIKFVIGERLKRLIATQHMASQLVNGSNTEPPVGPLSLPVIKDVTATSEDGIELPTVVATRKIDLKDLDSKESLM